jgi:hypothetical protein
MPINVPLHISQDCPVVGRPVLLSRERVFLDYVLMSEAAPTCSNLHACLGEYGTLKNIPACLLHSASKSFPIEDTLS